MKKTRGTRKNGANLTNTKSAVQSIVIALILVAGLVGITSIAINKSITNSVVNIDVWEKAFRDAESNKVGVEFDAVSTTENEYRQLRLQCNKYLEAIRNKSDLDTSIDTNAVVTEEEFIDNKEKMQTEINMENVGVDTKNFVETGPIYFNDLVMVRYVNTDGDLAIISSGYTSEEKTQDTIKLFKQSELASRYGWEAQENQETTSDIISEKQYIQIISDSLLNILRDGDDDYSKILQYFTYDGKLSIQRLNKELNLHGNTRVSLKVGLAGKSNTSKPIKDRVYLQFEVDNGLLGSYNLNIVAKVNKNLKIFDLDWI